MEGIGDKGERMDGITSDEFQQEKSRINHQQDNNAIGLGKRHDERTARSVARETATRNKEQLTAR